MTDAAQVVTALATTRRAVQLYPPTHPSHIDAIDALSEAVGARVATEGQFVLNLHQGHLYSGSEVIPSETPAAGALANSMERHRVESLTFHTGFSSSDSVALAEVLNMRPAPELSVEEELEKRGVTTVVVAALADEDAEEREERDRQRERDRALYKQLVTLLRSLHGEFAQSGSPDLDQASGMVGNIMSRMIEDDAAVLGLAMMNSRDEATQFHPINVMIYALTLGLGLGLPDEGLMSLGMAALLHDVGKAPFDLDDPAEAERARAAHPTIGAEILGRLPDPDRTPMLVAYEHHMGADGSGYPPHEADYIGHPYSRMVAIADRYENLTKKGDDGQGAMTPDRAVVQLLREAGHSLDPMFARLFVRSLGVFPIGCVVRLSDQSIGVVTAKGDDPLRPRLLLAYGPDGLDDPDDPVVDLTHDERSIIEVVDPGALDMEVSEHL